jgi:hypothetical protein
MDIVGYPVRIAYNNLFEDAAITANTQETALPFSNVANPLYTRVGRAAGLTNQVEITFQIALGDTTTGGNLFALKGHNLEAGATIAIIGATNSDFLPVAISLGMTNAADIITGEFPANRTETYWRIQISNQGVTPVEIGYVFFGGYKEFDIPDFATSMRTIDPSVVVNAYGGGRSTFKKNHFRVIDFALSPLQQADRREIETVYDFTGTAEPVFLMLDPWSIRDNENVTTGLDGLHRLTMLGYLSAGLNIDHLARDWFDGPTITFEEARE